MWERLVCIIVTQPHVYLQILPLLLVCADVSEEMIDKTLQSCETSEDMIALTAETQGKKIKYYLYHEANYVYVH